LQAYARLAGEDPATRLDSSDFDQTTSY